MSLVQIGSPLRIADDKGRIHRYGVYRCSCGHFTSARISNVNANRVTSCGCVTKEKRQACATTHGLCYSYESKCWRQIIQRCTNPKRKDFPRYGGRGIRICDKWRNSFAAFYADMGPRPSERHSIDRIDNNGNYEPGNCRWLENVGQCNNRRSNRTIEIDGRIMTVAQWSHEPGAVRVGLIYERLDYGWEGKRAVFAPLRRAKQVQ